ncbi:hypothetical protein HYY72_03340 [Candidatus Woesearchaeota archaeon]|nr:hypothetical protein [Candidatus Woesearchaeota archaeon]
MPSDILYMGIENPNVIRKGVLESSKDLIQFLQKYEKLKAIRAEKQAQIAKLRIIYDDILSMIPEIKSELPKIDVKTLPKWDVRMKEELPAEEHEIAEPGSEEKKIPKKRMPSVDRLEAELNDIEQKLKSIA